MTQLDADDLAAAWNAVHDALPAGGTVWAYADGLDNRVI
jgi:hypothetical protein